MLCGSYNPNNMEVPYSTITDQVVAVEEQGTGGQGGPTVSGFDKRMQKRNVYSVVER